MPSYLDFNSTEDFRGKLINRTLKTPNGPHTFTQNDYILRNLRDIPNVDQGDVDDERSSDLLTTKNANVFKPENYFIVEDLTTIPRRVNLGLYPYFTSGSYNNFVGILSSSDYDQESELMKFAAWNISKNPNGPLFSRLQQNLYSSTVGRVRLIDALGGNTSTAINILKGKEPIIEGNSKITASSSLTGKAVDLLGTIAGVEMPWTVIPGDYLSNPSNPIVNRPESPTEFGRVLQDATGAIGSLIGIQRRPTTTRKPSDLFIEYMGSRQKSFLFDNLSYSKYAPDYTTTARSQNTSRIFNFLDNVGEGVKNLLGIEAPKGMSYIGDDRGDDVKFAMGDFNDRQVRSSYYLTLMFDPVQTKLFENQKNIGEGGSVSGKLTWISSKSKNRLGEGNAEYNTERSQIEESLSTQHDFRKGSILDITQDILESMPSDGGAAISHVANVIDQTSRIFREGDVMISRGSAVKYVDKYKGVESGVEYCRVWTKDRSYMHNSDTMKRSTNSRKFEGSVLSKPWNLNIYPNSNGKNDFGSGSTNILKGDGGDFYAKKYMFSIENLAWKSSNTPGFTFDSLPYCERGPNGGRVMWFPPYDLKVSEQSNASWEANRFLGRPEPVYTYSHTERTGQVSFKVIVDHPSILNLMVKEHFNGMSDDEADNYINAFFSGCEEVDFYGLIQKYVTLTRDEVESIKQYLNDNRDGNVVLNNKTVLTPIMPDDPSPVESSKVVKIVSDLYFKNNYPKAVASNLPDALYCDPVSDSYRMLYQSYVNDEDGYLNDLDSGLQNLKNRPWDNDSVNDFRVIFGQEFSEKPDDATIDQYIVEVKQKIVNGFERLRNQYETYSNGLNEIRNKLSKNQVKGIRVRVTSQTSSIGDDVSNLRLSYRRNYSIISDILSQIATDGNRASIIDNFSWDSNIDENTVKSTQPEMSISLKNFGYESEGNFVLEYTSSLGEQPIGSEDTTGVIDVGCTEAYRILTSPELKRTAPTTFYCRNAVVEIEYDEQPSDTKPTEPPVAERTLVEVTDTTGGQPTPPIDEIKRIIMKVLSECYYFKMLEEDSPVQFSSLREKLKYFHPAFHSMTPEGLNSRLTFLQQCVRPGDTLPVKGISDVSDLTARNTSFGPPPICILRVGDYFNSKVVIRDVNISYDDTIWDFNPEGIGVQPMIANVTLQVNFIGGHGLEKPVERLQNALSSNFYANTEMYDPRSVSTEDRSKFYQKVFDTNFLDRVNDRDVVNTNADGTISGDNVIKGQYIGEKVDNYISYTNLITRLYDQGEKYFSSFIDSYNEVVGLYDTQIASMVISPTYRTINGYTVQIGSGTKTINLIGNYARARDITVSKITFKSAIKSAIESNNISQIFGFDRFMTNAILIKSEEILKPSILKWSLEVIDGISSKLMSGAENSRNEIIKTMDRLNFIIETSGHDGKIDGDDVIGATFVGYTYDLLYNEYSSVIDYFESYHNILFEDVDTTYNFNSGSMTTNELSYFLSVLLRGKNNDIENLYGNDPIFTNRIKKGIEKNVTSFIRLQPNRKVFNLPKFPKRKNGNEVKFDVVSEDFVFTDGQKETLKNTLRISGNEFTTGLNYYRK